MKNVFTENNPLKNFSQNVKEPGGDNPTVNNQTNSAEVANGKEKKRPFWKRFKMPRLQPTSLLEETIHLFKGAYTLEKLRVIIANLEEENPENRTMLKTISQRERDALLDYFKMQLSILWENDFHNMDKNNPASVERLLNWNKEPNLLYAVTVANLNKPTERLVPGAYEMMGSGIAVLDTVEKIDSYHDRHKHSIYFPGEYDRRKKEQEKWILMLLEQAAKVATENIARCLVSPTERSTEDEAKDFFSNMIYAESVINRRNLSIEVRNKFLKEFQPVLQALIVYFRKFSINLVIAKYLVKAYEINDSLYVQKESDITEKPTQQPIKVKNDSQKPADKNVVATTDEPKATVKKQNAEVEKYTALGIVVTDAEWIILRAFMYNPESSYLNSEEKRRAKELRDQIDNVLSQEYQKNPNFEFPTPNDRIRVQELLAKKAKGEGEDTGTTLMNAEHTNGQQAAVA